MARWIGQLWIEDTRDKKKRNVSGIRKVGSEIAVEGGVADALEAVTAAVGTLDEKKQAAIRRIRLEQSGEAGGIDFDL